MHIAITEFKAKCTQFLRDLQSNGEKIEVTNRGKVIAVIEPFKEKDKLNPAWGSLKGTVSYIADDFDEPLGDNEWEASH